MFSISSDTSSQFPDKLFNIPNYNTSKDNSKEKEINQNEHGDSIFDNDAYRKERAKEIYIEEKRDSINDEYGDLNYDILEKGKIEENVQEDKSAVVQPSIVQAATNTISSEKKVEDIAASALSKPQAEIAPIPSEKISFGKRILSKIINLYDKIKTLFLLHLIIRPTMSKCISQELKDIDPKDYKTNYTKFMLSSNDLIKTLNDKYKLFSEEVLKSDFENIFANKANKILKKNKLPLMTRKEIVKASVEAKEIIIKSAAEKKMQSLLGSNVKAAEITKQLSTILPENMPVDLLAKIEITEETSKVLINSWKKLINDLIAGIGDLNKTSTSKESNIKIKKAVKLLELTHLVPRFNDKELNSLKRKLSEKRNEQNLRDYIFIQNAVHKLDTVFKDEQLIKQNDIFENKLKEKLESEFRKITKKNAADEILIVLNNENKNILNSLTASLDSEESKIISISLLEKMIHSKAEVSARQDYFMTETQISNIAEQKDRREDKALVLKEIKKQIKSFSKLKAKYNSNLKSNENESSTTQNSKSKKGNEKKDKINLNNDPDYIKFVEKSAKDCYAELSSKFENVLDCGSAFSKIKISRENEMFCSKLYECYAEGLLVKKFAAINNPKNKDVLYKDVKTISKFKTQINALRISEDSSSLILRKLNGFKDSVVDKKTLELFSLPLNELKQDFISKKLYTQEVMDSLITEGYSHPSAIPAEVLVDLMKLSKIGLHQHSLEKNGKSKEISQSEKNEVEAILKKFSAIPGLKQLLKRIKYKDGTASKQVDNLEEVEGYKPDISEITYRLPLGISEPTYNMVIEYLRMVETHQDLSLGLFKGEQLLNKYRENPASVKATDRLTFHEFGNLVKLSKKLELLKKMGAYQDPITKQFIHEIDRAKVVVKDIEDILLPVFGIHYKDGDIFGYVGKRKAAWKGAQVLSSIDKLAMNFCSKGLGLTHGMKAYVKNNELFGSEISQSYVNQKMRVYDVAVSRVWRLDISKLISPSVSSKLAEALGSDYELQLRSMYEKIENDIHMNKSTCYKGLENSKVERSKAGRADYSWFFNLLTPFTKEKIKGHQRRNEQDFSKIHNKFMNNVPLNETQICSEFASKSTLAALVELNKQLSVVIKDKNPELSAENILKKISEKNMNIPQDIKDYLNGTKKFGKERIITKNIEQKLITALKELKYSKNQIDLIMRLNNDEILDIPYDRKERMNAIHPSRMIKILQKKNCVTELPPPRELTTLLKI